MLDGLGIGNKSLSLGAMLLWSQIEPASQIIKPVTTVCSSLLSELELLEIAVQLVHFLYQQLGNRCSYFRRKTGIVQETETEVMINVCTRDKLVHDAELQSPNVSSCEALA